MRVFFIRVKQQAKEMREQKKEEFMEYICMFFNC
jgi:hypothetical protein